MDSMYAKRQEQGFTRKRGNMEPETLWTTT